MWKIILWILSITLLVLFLLCILVSFLLFRFACKRVKDKQTSTKKKLEEAAPAPHNAVIQAGMAYLNDQPYEAVSITTYDGLVLRGRFYPAATDAKRTILCVHGFYSYGLHDFGGVADFYLPNQCFPPRMIFLTWPQRPNMLTWPSKVAKKLPFWVIMIATA